MTPLLLDTHTLIWFYAANKKLGNDAHKKINQLQKKGEVYISAISFWEIAMLNNNNRLEINIPTFSIRRDIIESGLREISVDGEIGIIATEIENFHKDPADRIIIATALRNSLGLVTADTNILKWKGRIARYDARK